MRGHAIECRINAEDPYKFAPSPGASRRGTRRAARASASIRTSTTNYFVPPNYDSMIGKIIAYGDTREQAIARMRIALSEMVVEGIKTNIPLHQELMLDDKFLRGGTSIHYLEERLAKRKARRGVTAESARRSGDSARGIAVSYLALRFDADAARAPRRWADALLEAGALSVDVADAARRHAGARRRCSASPASPASRCGRCRALDRAVRGRLPTSTAALACRGGGVGRPLPAVRAATRVADAGLGARDAGAVRADRDRRAGSGSCRRGASRPSRPRSTSRSIPGSRSAPARIRRRACACVARGELACAARRCSTTAAAPASSRSPR